MATTVAKTLIATGASSGIVSPAFPFPSPKTHIIQLHPNEHTIKTGLRTNKTPPDNPPTLQPNPRCALPLHPLPIPQHPKLRHQQAHPNCPPTRPLPAPKREDVCGFRGTEVRRREMESGLCTSKRGDLEGGKGGCRRKKVVRELCSKPSSTALSYASASGAGGEVCRKGSIRKFWSYPEYKGYIHPRRNTKSQLGGRLLLRLRCQ